MHRGLVTLALALVAVGCVDNRPRGGDAGGPPSGDADLPLEDGGAPPDIDAGPALPPGTTCTTGYACPEGATFELVDGEGRCLWHVGLPDTAGVEPYCRYFDDGYFGFYWPLPSLDPGYECPAGFRFAPNADWGYCLYEDFALPPGGALPYCDALLSTGRLGFRWLCP